MTTSGLTLRPFLEGFKYLEAPRWYDGHLWFSDVFQGQVFRATPDGQVEPVATVAGAPVGLGFMPDGTPLVASQRDHRLYRIGPGGNLEEHADLTAIATGLLNDMVVDANGNAYVGNFGFDMSTGEPPKPARLALVRPDGGVETAAEDLLFANGSAISPDGRTLLVAETFAARITAFVINQDGTLGERRTWAQLDERYTPDGMCLDADGCVWAGNPLASVFIRVRQGGEIVDEIPTPGRWAVAPALGGSGRRTLYCLTAETSVEDQPRGISKAWVGQVEAPAPGAGIP